MPTGPQRRRLAAEFSVACPAALAVEHGHSAAMARKLNSALATDFFCDQFRFRCLVIEVGLQHKP